MVMSWSTANTTRPDCDSTTDGMPADRMVEMVETLEQLGTLAEAVVVTTLRDALQARAESFIRAEADRLGIEIPRPGAPEPPA
jgi:hypothetical protein